jgi:hypothetical protein
LAIWDLSLEPCTWMPGIYHLAIPVSLFTWSYFSDMVLPFALGRPLTTIPLPVASHAGGMINVHLHVGLLCCDGVSVTFCPGWPWVAILLISVFLVAGITGVNYHIWVLPSPLFRLLSPLRDYCKCLSTGWYLNSAFWSTNQIMLVFGLKSFCDWKL